MITNAENFQCPSCNKMFTEGDLIELCNEPFNGTVVCCSGCEKEWSCDLQITIEEI